MTIRASQEVIQAERSVDRDPRSSFIVTGPVELRAACAAATGPTSPSERLCRCSKRLFGRFRSAKLRHRPLPPPAFQDGPVEEGPSFSSPAFVHPGAHRAMGREQDPAGCVTIADLDAAPASKAVTPRGKLEIRDQASKGSGGQRPCPRRRHRALSDREPPKAHRLHAIHEPCPSSCDFWTLAKRLRRSVARCCRMAQRARSDDRASR